MESTRPTPAEDGDPLDALVLEHDEAEGGHEEVYFVHEGEALAILDGEELRAPTGRSSSSSRGRDGSSRRPPRRPRSWA